MDSKNPMRDGVLELGEQIKQKFSREDTKCPTREPVSREHSEGKKIVKKIWKDFDVSEKFLNICISQF